MNVRLFNEKLGLYKDANNYNILSTSFNEITGQFPVDTIYISATEFLQNVHIPNILSVGKLETLYTDFIQYVNAYVIEVGSLEQREYDKLKNKQ
jgi:hypothetical protein